MTEVWGLLEKSQVDPQKIDAAIAVAIAAHEADPSAHVDVGESLQSHKAAEIIDHVVGSVVRDKLTFDRFNFDTMFETLDVWVKTVGVSTVGFGDVQIITSGANLDLQQMYCPIGGDIAGQGHPDRLPHWVTRVRFHNSTLQTIYIGQFATALICGIGFFVNNNFLYSFYSDSGSVGHALYELTIVVDTWYFLEVEVVDTTHVIWKVNGVVVSDLSGINLYTDLTIMKYLIQAKEAAVKQFSLQTLHWDANYVA